MNVLDSNYVVSGIRRRSLIVLAAALSGVVLSGCHGEKRATGDGPALPVANVRVEKVTSVTAPVFEAVVGTIRSDKRATLEAKVSGRISELPVMMGQRVKQGELVARLDAAETRARYEQVAAALEQAQREWKRLSSLFEQQASTRADYEAAESRFRMAEAAFAEAKAMMAYVEIVAPFDGVVTRKWADVGDLAAPGKALVGIEDPKLLLLEADVPEGLGANLHTGAKLTVDVDALKTEFEGTVREMAPIADPETRSVRIKVQLPETPGLLPGQFARLRVPIREVPQLRVPRRALVERGQLELVFVAETNHARLHLVKSGKRYQDTVEILAGLEPGEMVVTEGAMMLVDGQPLNAQ